VIQDRKAEIDRIGLAGTASLVSLWLGEEPAGDLDDFADQAARAYWLEERFFNNLARILGAKK
jgi:hypothetical protein